MSVPQRFAIISRVAGEVAKLAPWFFLDYGFLASGSVEGGKRVRWETNRIPALLWFVPHRFLEVVRIRGFA